MKAPPAAAAPAPKPCTGLWGFIATNCQLTWQGITVYGMVDVGVGWQSHGAPFDPRSAVGLILDPETEQVSDLDACTQRVDQFIHWNQRNKLIAGDLSGVFALTRGSTRIPSDSPMDRVGCCECRNSPNQATAYSDSSRAGQWYNGQGYVGVSSPTYGTLTVFRQNSLTLDAVLDYDPFGAHTASHPSALRE